MRHLEDEGHKVTKAGVHKFWKCFEEIENIQRKPGSGRKAKFCLKAEEIVEEQMAVDDETTGEELKRVLQKTAFTFVPGPLWSGGRSFFNARNFDKIP